MQQIPIFTPAQVHSLAACTLQYHFSLQLPDDDFDWNDQLETHLLTSIHHLHAQGGPQRLNLPATLRHFEQSLPTEMQTPPAQLTRLRQTLALYHRRLRQEWPKVIASQEALSLNISLRRGSFRCEATLHRVDREEDGGVTAVELIPSADPIPSEWPDDDVQATLHHALLAATYPNKRPVRLRQLWLHHNQERWLELDEGQYRRNINLVRQRVQAWLNSEILARPGLHCDVCPFKYRGCPLFGDED